MMASVLGIRPSSLSRWRSRGRRPIAVRRPRASVIPESARWAIRRRYTDSLGQWGPSVLACWARREELGSWSPTTIGRVIADLRPPRPASPKWRHYAVATPGVMWSEDGAAFREGGRKKELLLIQDECSRYKVHHRLADGPATGADVRAALEEAFHKNGVPLVLKRDGGSIFDEESVRRLLDDLGVVVITSPPRCPRYNGRMERAVRDVRSHERAQRRCGFTGTLEERLGRAMLDLNEQRPRPVLGGRTAGEVQRDSGVRLPSRAEFRRRVAQIEARLVGDAASRHQRDAARRRAVEDVLSSYGLMAWTGDMSTNSVAETGTS